MIGVSVGAGSSDYLPIAVRAYVPLAVIERPRRQRPIPTPSEWVLVFDTETTTDPAQRLRFGSFQLRHAGKLVKHGLFYDPAALTVRDQRLIRSFARANGLELLTVADSRREPAGVRAASPPWPVGQTSRWSGGIGLAGQTLSRPQLHEARVSRPRVGLGRVDRVQPPNVLRQPQDKVPRLFRVGFG